MTTAPAWISLSERKPTAEDADENGNVWWHSTNVTRPFQGYWYAGFTSVVSFHPIPKRVAPPLPKPVEKSQEEKDYEKCGEIFRAKGPGSQFDAHAFANWARAEERAKLLGKRFE